MLSEIQYTDIPLLGQILAPLCYGVLGLRGISTFSILLMLAFLSASFLLPRELTRRGLRPEIADWTILLGVVGAIVGSKVFYVFEV